MRARHDNHLPADRLLRLAECRSYTEAFAGLIRDTAARVNVGARALAVRSLLHLPRVASPHGLLADRSLQREVWANADRLRLDQRAAQNDIPAAPFTLAELSFEEIHQDRAETVFRSLHYLRSARKGSLNFALVEPEERLPVSLVSISPLEWMCVRDEICDQLSIAPERIWEVSRMYSVDGAPANAISYLLSRLRSHLQQRNDFAVELLATAVDPNLGFTGSSYRAANWQQWIKVRARPYVYEWGSYVTPRQLREWYGTSNPNLLRARYPRRFEQSRVRLLDSYIYCCSVRGETAASLPQGQRLVHRRPRRFAA